MSSLILFKTSFDALSLTDSNKSLSLPLACEKAYPVSKESKNQTLNEENTYAHSLSACLSPDQVFSTPSFSSSRFTDQSSDCDSS